MDHQGEVAVFGVVPDGLGPVPAEAVQFSPLIPGAARLEDLEPGSLASLTMLAPPGTAERRYAMALGLGAVRPGGDFAIMAPKAKGGARLGPELATFGCTVEESGKRHHRICTGRRPRELAGVADAIAAGAPRRVDGLGLWSQPGIFSWDRVDPGSALLIEVLPELSGRGADLGCGIGALSHAVLRFPKVRALVGIDVDRRAVDAAARNLDDPRVTLRWLDLRAAATGLTGLDFVVMNPPFHGGGGVEDQGLGQLFIRRAAECLRSGGSLWLTANRHLPYEEVLAGAFKTVTPVAERDGFKVLQARR